ncbi:hypothetical protein LPB072_09930 [Hydrogenophaga crassostreae]|uniref:Uncharacterized protein n=1 Tax=Hydrogenophaga crassostreae TaxID=1763535 RepID=A0A1D8NVK5_9BURK|nr:hypothetical protein LPB072_09930 [Hydrogenophaga crassostreae]
MPEDVTTVMDGDGKTGSIWFSVLVGAGEAVAGAVATAGSAGVGKSSQPRVALAANHRPAHKPKPAAAGKT